MSRGNQRGTIGIPRSVRRRCFRKGSGRRSSQLLSWFQSPQYRALEANTRFAMTYLRGSGREGKTRGCRIRKLHPKPKNYICRTISMKKQQSWTKSDQFGLGIHTLLYPSPGYSWIFHSMKWQWHIWTLAIGLLMALWHHWLCKRSGPPILGIVRLHYSPVNGLFRWSQENPMYNSG